MTGAPLVITQKKSSLESPRLSPLGVAQSRVFNSLARYIVLVAGRRFGKALALDTPIPTPDGWTTMGALAVGDSVYDEQGKVCRVTAATDVMHDRPCYEIEFSDGTKVTADADHQWLTWDRHARKNAARNARWVEQHGRQGRHWHQGPQRVTAEIRTTRTLAGSLTVGKRGDSNHSVQCCDPVDGHTRPLPIGGYTLGVWLGDGHSAGSRVTGADPEIFAHVAADGERVIKGSAPYAYTISPSRRGRGRHAEGTSLTVRLKRLGVLRNKHIPADYLRADTGRRLALLQGLMDTDGTVSPRGHCEFTCTSERLAADVLDLVRSLGIRASTATGEAKLDGRVVSPKYRVTFTTDLPVFRLSRKVVRQRDRVGGRNISHRFITAVRPVQSVPVRCIQVDSPSHLFLCSRAYLPTHNSTLEAQRLFKKAYTKPDSINWYVAPTYSQGKTIFWDILKDTVPRMYVLKKNESELTIVLKNRSKITVKGADNPDSLRGPRLDHVSFDEFANIKLEAWNVIRPALADRGGTAAFIGSPAGFNHLYEFYNRGTIYRDRANRAGRFPWRSWEGFLFTTLQGGRVPLDEIEAARDELDPRVFRQEFLASFETLAGRVYGNFSRQQWPLGNIDPHIIDVQRELYIGLDFNINPMSAVVIQQVFGRPEVLDAIQLMTSDTEEMAQHLKARFPDRRIIICPDASGKARHTSSPMGQTDFTILQRHGFELLMDRANPVVVDRINNVQSNLLSGSGYRAVHVHPRCEYLIKGLEGLTWKKGTSIVDKSTGLDHICFAAGTPIETDAGVLPIEHLPASGRVRGPHGDFVPYVGAGCTKRSAPVVRVEFADGESVVCTPDHPFLTDRGWLRADALAGSICYTWVCDMNALAQRSKSLMGSATTSAVPTSNAMASGCTASSTKRISDRSPRARTSTTSIWTAATTTPGISGCCAQRVMPRFTCNPRRERTWRVVDCGMPGFAPVSGTEVLTADCGTASTISACAGSSTAARTNASALNVARNSAAHGRPESSAPRTARRPIGVGPALTTRHALARIARSHFASTSIPGRGAAPTDAARSGASKAVVRVTPAGVADVYNLTVPGIGAFALPSGVVVSNCDAFGYALWQVFNVLAKHVPAVAPIVSDLTNFYNT